MAAEAACCSMWPKRATVKVPWPIDSSPDTMCVVVYNKQPDKQTYTFDRTALGGGQTFATAAAAAPCCGCGKLNRFAKQTKKKTTTTTPTT